VAVRKKVVAIEKVKLMELIKFQFGLHYKHN
jgi:hypothetical protein